MLSCRESSIIKQGGACDVMPGRLAFWRKMDFQDVGNERNREKYACFFAGNALLFQHFIYVKILIFSNLYLIIAILFCFFSTNAVFCHRFQLKWFAYLYCAKEITTPNSNSHNIFPKTGYLKNRFFFSPKKTKENEKFRSSYYFHEIMIC